MAKTTTPPKPRYRVAKGSLKLRLLAMCIQPVKAAPLPPAPDQNIAATQAAVRSVIASKAVA